MEEEMNGWWRLERLMFMEVLLNSLVALLAVRLLFCLTLNLLAQPLRQSLAVTEHGSPTPRLYFESSLVLDTWECQKQGWIWKVAVLSYLVHLGQHHTTLYQIIQCLTTTQEYRWTHLGLVSKDSKEQMRILGRSVVVAAAWSNPNGGFVCDVTIWDVCHGYGKLTSGINMQSTSGYVWCKFTPNMKQI